MTSHAGTLGSRELLSFPPQQQDSLDASQFNLDTDISLLTYHPPQPPRLTYQHEHIPTPQRIPGHPLIIPQPESGTCSSAGSENNSESINKDDPKNVSEIRASSPDYDNLMPVARLSQVEEQGGQEVEVKAINELCAHSAVNSPLDASGVGGVGTRKGGPFDDESSIPRVGLGYKSGYGDSSNTGSCSDDTDGYLDVSCAGVVVESAADVSRIEMGNDLFSARAASGGNDARAESHVSGSRKRVYDKFGSRRRTCSNQDNKMRVTDTTCNILHECNQNEVSRVSLCVVSPDSEAGLREQRVHTTDKAVGFEMNVFSSYPTVTKIQTGTSQGGTCVSSIPNGGKNSSFVTSSGVNQSSTCTTTFTHETARAVNEGTFSRTQTSSEHQPEDRAQVSEHPLVTTPPQSMRHPSSNSNPTTAATHIPLVSVSTPHLPVIIITTPSIPDATSPTSPTNTSTSGSSQEPSPHSARTAKHESESRVNEDGKQHAGQPEVCSPDLQSAKGKEKASSKPAPVGGVKVLPSTFIFNARAFKDTTHSPAPTSPSPKTSATHSPSGHPTQPETVKSAKYSNSSDVKTSVEHIPGSIRGADITPANVSATVSVITERASYSSSWTNSGNKQQSSERAHGLPATTAEISPHGKSTQDNRQFQMNVPQTRVHDNITLAGSSITTEKTQSSLVETSESNQQSSTSFRQNTTFPRSTDDNSWDDYAVPSDLSPETPESGYISPESQVLSPDQNRSGDYVDGSTTSYRETQQHIKGNTVQPIPHSSAKITSDTEDIYAIPIPKKQRQVVSTQSTRRDVHQTQTVPDEMFTKPARVPLPKPAPSQAENDDDAFEDVVLRHTAQSTSQMKKSTTTGTLHSYSSDYSNIPKTSSRKYDYFSLGRRQKRPRIRTLIDSQGIAVSLDMLLKSRRQSFMDDSTPTSGEQTLSVDDILRSCSEFEEISAFNKSRTNTRSVGACSTHPLTFSEVTTAKILATVRSEKHEAHLNQAKSKPILKKGKNDSKVNDNRTSLKRNQVNVSPGAVVRGQANGGTKCQQAKFGFSKPSMESEIRAGSLERKTKTAISPTGGISSRDAKEVGALTSSQRQVSELKEQILASSPNLRNETTKLVVVERKGTLSPTTSSIATKSVVNVTGNTEVAGTKNTQDEVGGQKQQAIVPDAMRKPDQVKSYFAIEHETSEKHNVICNETGSNTNSGNTEKVHFPPGYANHNPDYEYPKDTIYPATSPSEIAVSTTGGAHNRTEESASAISTDVQRFGRQTSASTVTVTITQQPVTPSFDKQKKDEVPTSTTKVSTLDTKIDSQPFSTVSFSTSSQEAAIASIATSNHSSPLPTASAATGSGNFRNPSSSSSDITISPRSLRTGSDSSSVNSPGVMTSLSVDVSEASLGDSPSPVQRSPNLGPKLEAIEALKWLRAAGFPQYAQMFDDGQFPVDIGIVERDHDFLDKDSLQSLFRRLDTLNKYAGTRLDSLPSKKATSEEDDEDDFCALSERWEYQKSVRRWSRKDLTPSQKAAAAERSHRELAARSGSHDSLLADQDSGSQTGDSPLLDSKMPHQTVVQHHERVEMASLSHGGHAVADISPEDQKGSPISPRLRRAASDRMKTAKNLFKKMDGLKSTKSRRQANSRTIVEISGPVLADRENMQVKLDRLNCVDISQPTETLPSPPLGHTKPSRFVSRASSSDAASHPTSPDQPHSPPVTTSPRPHSDFMLRPKDVTYPTHPNSTSQSRTSHASPTQTSSSSHDSSFDDYYHAKTTFLQNLQSPKKQTSEGVRKNNSDTNLVEIFLVPQDHQPGRFPRMLQNGYIETEACGTAVNVRTGSVRLGRGTGLTSDNRSPNSRLVQPFSAQGQGRGQRISVYDNFLPNDGKRLEGNEIRSPIPGVILLEGSTDNSSFSRGGVEINRPGLIRELKSSDQLDSRDRSRDSSVARTTDSLSDQEHTSSSHERSISYESSSSSSQTLRESSVSNEGVVTGDESTASRKSSPDSISSKSRGVTHSSSVDSYFRDSSSQGEASSNEAPNEATSSTFQQDYDEFDRILQDLYQNINDLTSFMDRDKNEKAPKLIRAATSPLPAGNKHTHSPLHVATPSSTRPLLKPQSAVDSSSPSIATSDLVPSPVSPRSPLDTSESLSFYRGLDLDNENSSSGGEGNTAESGSEDQEAALTDVSHDDSLDQIIEGSRERRDSGVGHSLTRASSDRRHKKIRWHSFQKSHRPDINSRAMQINSLTVGQLVRLQKLSLLRLTGIMEKCLPVNKSGWNWMVPRFMKRHKSPDFSDKNVFGVPLSVMAQRTGQPMPQCILYAMRYLRCTCQSAVGIFRKSGVKSKIQHLRDHLESHPDTTNFDGENTYNVADMLKTYFRDLPECLLTNKMSETFRSIYTYVPQSQRLEAIQAAILLLPDENREVLQSILLFLSDISDHETDHQMNASNLAVCFTPTVFHLGPRQSVPYSPKRNRKNSSGVPDPREILEQKAAHECLLMMITDCKKLFTVPHNIFRQLQVQSLAHMEPTLPQDIGNSPSDIRAFGQERIQMVLKESHDKNRGWIPTLTIGDVEVFHRKPMDDCPLKEWKLIVDIEAPPIEVLRRIMHERHTWDEDLLSWSVVERLDPFSDIFQFVLNSMAPHPPRNFCVLRYWRSDLNKGACSLITMSVEHSDALEIHGVWAIDLGTYFLMEPCGSGRSRLTYITRLDTRGRMPEWYTKIFGHISANFLDRLKESFKQDSTGPETKV